jgi:phosphatidate cytidylyltransferase
MAAIVIASLFLNEWIFAAILFVIVILGLGEFYKLVSSDNCHPQRVWGIISGVLIFLSVVFVNYARFLFGIIDPFFIPIWLPIPVFFLSFILEIFRKKPNPLTNISITIVGIFYIAFPLAVLNLLNDIDSVHFLGVPAFLLGYFIITWIYDTGAYLFGVKFGRHKFFERVSPKKTWEGTIAGTVISILSAVGLFFLVKDILLVDWLVLAGIVMVFGTFGDLIESLIKRSYQVKDSGNILPGHGGILDRFDTVFMSAPFVFLYFILRHSI